jgi:large subunit ribosomal protein L4
MDSLEFAEVKSKNCVQMMDACKLVQTTLFLVSEDDNWANAFTSGHNIPNVKMLPVAEINPIDLANADTVVLTEAAVKNLEEAYA